MKKSLSNDEELITNIFQKYSSDKIMANNINKLPINELETNYGTDQKTNIYDEKASNIKLIDTILALLPRLEYTFLIKSIMNNDQNWWKRHYSFSEFQRIKNRAIKRFLYLYLL